MEERIYYRGVNIRVVYNVSKYYPATRTDPAEGGEVEIEEIYLEGSKENIVDLLEPQWDEIIDQLCIVF